MPMAIDTKTIVHKPQFPRASDTGKLKLLSESVCRCPSELGQATGQCRNIGLSRAACTLWEPYLQMQPR